MSVRPIFGTDITKPPSETVETIRSGIAHLRGQLDDLGYAYPAWKSRLADVQGLLTCGLITLHNTKEEMRESEVKWGHKPPTAA